MAFLLVVCAGAGAISDYQQLLQVHGRQTLALALDQVRSVENDQYDGGHQEIIEKSGYSFKPQDPLF
jgi:hypothetical protein